MARITYAAQIDLRFGDAPCELLHLGIGVCPRNLARKRLDLFRQGRIGINRQAQSMPNGVSGRADAAVRGLRARASPRISAVCPDLTVARQAAFFPLAGVVSITLNSASSTSCTLRRSVSPRT